MILEALKFQDETKSASRLLFFANTGLVELSQQQLKNIKDHAAIDSANPRVETTLGDDIEVHPKIKSRRGRNHRTAAAQRTDWYRGSI